MVQTSTRYRSCAKFLFILWALNKFPITRGQQPMACPSDPSITGFTTLNDLNVFMVNIWTFINQGGLLTPPFFFTLCPHTVFSDDYIFPVLNDTWIICGEDGKSSNNCTLSNQTHIVIFPHEYNGTITGSLEQVNFFGLTMEESSEVSVAAYGDPSGWAYFYDCHWKRNNGLFGVHIEAEDTTESDSMFVQFEECSFQDDSYAHSAIFNHLGHVLLTDCTFENVSSEWGTILGFYHYQTSVYDTTFHNTRNYFTVGAVGGHLNLYDSSFIGNSNELATVYVSEVGGIRSVGSTFLNNTHSLGTVLLSDDSFLLLNEENIGLGNGGVAHCEGFWSMELNTTCNEIDCPGTCCEFGNITCDLKNDTFTSSPSVSMFPSSAPSQNPASLPITGPNSIPSTTQNIGEDSVPEVEEASDTEVIASVSSSGTMICSNFFLHLTGLFILFTLYV